MKKQQLIQIILEETGKPNEMNNEVNPNSSRMATFNRMNGLVNIKQHRAFIEGARGMMKDLVADGFERPDVEEYFNYLTKNVIYS